MKNKVLVIGSGGREHALGWKLKQSKKVGDIYFAPGNAGTSEIGENVPICSTDISSLLKFARTNKIDLTIVGPDDVLAKGIVDRFLKKGLTIFGPTKNAARIESSKVFAKQLMRKKNIPTADFEKFSDPAKAKKYLQEQKFPLVIKASGLALGKGVIIVQNLKDGEKTIDQMMTEQIFGDAGKEIVIEEFLEGDEISIHAFCDGKKFRICPTARDHKAIFNGNKGPNTGGMGTIAPVRITKRQLEEIGKKIIKPLLEGMEERGTPFSGCLFPGLIMTKQGPKVLEFNSRFGDPETQTLMRLLRSDLFEILLGCAKKKLDQKKISWRNEAACCVILASGGYPGKYDKGKVISGLDAAKKDIVVFHAGTSRSNDQIITDGGRVLGISATGKNLKAALKKAYTQIGPGAVSFEKMHYRTDIGENNGKEI